MGKSHLGSSSIAVTTLPAVLSALLGDAPRLCGRSWIPVDHRRPSCAVFAAGGYYAKWFAPDRLREFERERGALEFAGAVGLAAPPVVFARAHHPEGHILITKAAMGRPLSELAGEFSCDALCRALEAIGAWVGACHSASVPRGSHLRLTSHARERSRALRSARETLAMLQDSGLLQPAAASDIERLLIATGHACFSTPVVPAHGDLNAEHAFLWREPSGRWCCMPIDFGCAGRCRQELDLVYPMLYILGDPTIRARLGQASASFWNEPAVRCFESGYRTRCELPLPWPLVTCHAVCWHLEVARACLCDHSGQGPAGARPVIETARQWATQF